MIQAALLILLVQGVLVPSNDGEPVEAKTSNIIKPLTIPFLHYFFIAQPCNQDGATRLLNFTSDVYAGFVEVCLNGEWGTVCADSPTTLWSEKNAQVFCIGLGYSGALNSVNQST